MISGIRYQLGSTQVVGDKLFEYQSSRLSGGEFFWIINIIPLLILLKLLRVKFKLFLLAIDRLLQFVLIWPCSSYSPLFLIPKCVIVCDKFICLLFLLLPF